MLFLEIFRLPSVPLPKGSSKCCRLVAGIFLVCILSLVAAEERVVLAPLYQRSVHDFANIISEPLEKLLEKEILETKKTTTAEMAVITVPSLQDMTIEDYSNEIFNRWGIGLKSTNNGVLLLVAPNERRTRIEVGVGLEPLISDTIAGEIVDLEIIPQFKSRNLEQGIKNGTLAILDLLERYPDQARSITGSFSNQIVFTRSRIALIWGITFVVISTSFYLVSFFIGKGKNYPGYLFFMILFILIGVAIIALLQLKPYLSVARSSHSVITLIGLLTGFSAITSNFRKFKRYRAHYCTKCSTKLTLLSETEDDQYLAQEESLEESLSSVDYDIWVCPACLSQEKKAYIELMSHFKECPECRHRTFAESERILVAATKHSTGTKEVNRECRSCWHKTKSMMIIPIISDHHGVTGRIGKSGGGFGGGGSRGGGASGGW